MGFEEVRSGTVLYFFVPDYFSRSNKITLNVELIIFLTDRKIMVIF